VCIFFHKGTSNDIRVNLDKHVTESPIKNSLPLKTHLQMKYFYCQKKFLICFKSIMLCRQFFKNFNLSFICILINQAKMFLSRYKFMVAITYLVFSRELPIKIISTVHQNNSGVRIGKIFGVFRRVNNKLLVLLDL